jgi:hypothetical protein
MEESLRKRVFRMVRNDPDISVRSLMKQFPGEKYNSIRFYRNEARKLHQAISKGKKRKGKGKTNLSQSSIQTNPSLSPTLPDYSKWNVKKTVYNYCMHQLNTSGRFAGQALQTLTKPEFLERSEIKHGVYWTSDMPPYRRPSWVYPWQSVGIDFMLNGHTLWQAGRQKIGKTTGAFMADFEDMLTIPGTVVTLVAPGLTQAEALLRQGFKEILTLDNGSKFDLWNQLYQPYFIVDNVKKMVMKNGSLLQVIPLSEYTTPGYATDILHIEELDKTVKDPQKLRGLGAILPTIRARRDYAKLRVTCNNTSGIYRILREDLKDLYPYVVIYMEKPYDINTQKFTGKHFVYNEFYKCKKVPDIDEILKRIMDCTMGQAYTKQQIGNVDDYGDDTFNPDKMELAYKKGKSFVPKEIYDHVVMGIDPGAIHAFAITIYAKERLQIYHLWTGRFTISGKTSEEQEKMLKKIAKTCAQMYVLYNCEYIASESNSGARLIIPLINYYIKKELKRLNYSSHAEVAEPLWSNFGQDREMGEDAKKIYARADLIMLMQYLFDYEVITLQDRNEDEHTQKVEFARYKPSESKEKYKGDCVDASLHAVWNLCGGEDYIKELTGESEASADAYSF